MQRLKITKSARAFERSVQEFFFEMPEEVCRQQRILLAENIFQGVVERTPVGSGMARAGWNVSNNIPDDKLPSSPDPEGRSTISNGTVIIRRARGFGVTWIVNNLPYIHVLDQGGYTPPDPGPSRKGGEGGSRKGKVLVSGGYSTQAPRGMVDVTIGRVLFSAWAGSKL